MRGFPRPAAVYILFTIGLGAAVLLRQASLPPASPALLAQIALFALISALADLRQLQLSYHASYSVSTAINFASVIIFGPQAAVWISFVGSAIGDIWKRKPWYRVAFNACAIAISVAAGAAVLTITRSTQPGTVSPDDLPAYAGYMLVNSTTNSALVFTVIALATRTRPWEVAVANVRGLLLPIIAMFPLGVLMAVTYLYFGGMVGLALLVLPTVAVYGALNKAQQLREHTRAALEALADTIDQRDHYTAEHSRRVAQYAEGIATVLGLSLVERETLVAAARVHDLGKISTPDAILRKPGDLDDCEWRIMREHPQAGAAILEKLPMYREHAKLVAYHHERLDGAGYPYGLSGAAIPLGARILAVADAFDAMTSDRPYRRAMPAAVAIARLRDAAGTQFCPQVVEALARSLALNLAPLPAAAPRAPAPSTGVPARVAV